MRGETNDDGNATGPSCSRIVLYRADGADRELSLDELAPPSREDDLLWVDIECDAAELVAEVCRKLAVPGAACRHLAQLESTPSLYHYGKFLVIHAVAVEHAGGLKFDGTVLAMAAGNNIVITAHHKPLAFIPSIREREQGDTKLGLLTASSFVASLLDWHLGTYFEAVSDFEVAVERLEASILNGRKDEDTRQLIGLRRGASRLRRMLAPHRGLFSGLTRPDFQPENDAVTTGHFHRLDAHFERAMDAVENARELMIGTFELFSNQIALRTNGTMRLLTFATVIIGCQTVIAGVLGMNFKASLFEAKTFGFWAAIASMAAVTLVAVWIGRKKDWF
jgi:magnesium/cobalt transport protein CorA